MNAIECRSEELVPFIKRLKGAEQNVVDECQAKVGYFYGQFEKDPNYEVSTCFEEAQEQVNSEKDVLSGTLL